MKPFEIPYNFDTKLIDALYILQPSGDSYHCIYMPPYYEDYEAASHYLTHTLYDQNMATIQRELTRKGYIEHVQYINKIFPHKQMLLLQRQDQIMDKTTLRFYLGLGFTKFCVGTIEQAKIIKSISLNFEVIGSISMKITKEKLNKNPDYFKYFDGFVLFFPFNRNLNKIKNLPKNFKYVLLVNCDCNIRCPGEQHWFASKENELIGNVNCPNDFYTNNIADWSEIIRIRPMDLPIFDDYISYYKIRGREFPTSTIFMTLCTYMADYSFYPGIVYDEKLYQN